MKKHTHKNIILLMLLIFVSCQKKHESSTINYQTVQVKTFHPIHTVIPVDFTGVLEAHKEMKLSFKISGYIATIPVKEGQKVRKGQILAQLQLQEIQAAYNRANSAFKHARWNYERLLTLQKENVISQAQLQEAKAAFEAAQSALKQAEFNLNHSTIKAPSNGTVLKIIAHENELIAAGMPILFFGTTDKTWIVKTSLSSSDVIHIRVGDSAFFKINELPEIKFAGSIEEIASMANPMTGTYEIKISLSPDSYIPQLKSGMIGKGRIFTHKKLNTIILPYSAVVESIEDGVYYMSVDSNFIAHKEFVQPFYFGDNGIYCPVSTLAGKKIIISGAQLVEDGEKVVIR